MYFRKTLLALALLLGGACDREPAPQPAPRIVNIVNFIRQNDYRLEDSEARLYRTVEEQVALADRYAMPTTFLVQYDALIRPEYQQLLKNGLRDDAEVGGWFEITQPQVEAAGLVWRGEHPWVSHANIAFSTGYTPEERERLTDVYMEKFREVFGRYPRSMGSWYIDAHTLAYMHEKYGIVASCNCKDQIGTDGYTLWGGYWNQAYYPSRRNGYMPAQSVEGQIPVPVFRMLGSDPIHQYDCGIGTGGQGVISLEPVYAHAGGDPAWVDRFLETIAEGPCLAFNYAQAGQENSFTWEAMREGLEMQMPKLDSFRRLGKLRIETLEESGRWFREHFSTTPPTAVTALSDPRGEGYRSVWFNSRYYRANLLWRGDDFRIRDIHLFDERFASAYVDRKGEGSRFFFYTLPVVDGHRWSTPDDRAGLRLVQLLPTGERQTLRLGAPVVTEPDDRSLHIECRTPEGHPFGLLFDEEGFTVEGPAASDLAWSLELHAAPGAELPFTALSGDRIEARFEGFGYALRCDEGSVSADASTPLRLSPSKEGRLALCCAER